MKIPIIDLHQDIMAHLKYGEQFKQWPQTDFDSLKKNNIKVVVATAWPVPPDGNMLSLDMNDQLEMEIKEYLKFCADRPEWMIIKNKKDFEHIFSSADKFGLVIHIEGLNVFNQKNIKLLDRWYELGLRSVGPVWNISNSLGGSVDNLDKGLTKLGLEVIRKLSAKKMLVDFSHMNRKTFFEAAAVYNGPIVVSHGNVDALCPSERNFNDEQLELIKKSQGVIGVFLAGKFVKKEGAKVEDVADHVEYIARKIGFDHVAIGSDLGGILSGGVEGVKHVAELGRLFEELISSGWTEEDLAKLAFKNALRIYRAILE